MASGDNVVKFRRTPRVRHGICCHCLWSCGALADSCDHPSVLEQTGRPIIKALAARGVEIICGSGAKHWSAKP
jgi:hypothetical protein